MSTGKYNLVTLLSIPILLTGLFSCGPSGSGGNPGPVTTYTITYDGNMNISGSVPVDSGTHTSGESTELPGNTGSLARWGCTWTGWNTQPDGKGTAYTEGDDIEVTENITLYAQWTTTTSGLAGEWLFNSDAADTSGNENNGTVEGATLTTDRFDETDQAYFFDGVDDFIEAADSESLDLSTGATISLWVYFDVNNPSCNLLNKQGAYGIGLVDMSNIIYNWEGDAGNNFIGEALSSGTWHHVVTYFDGSYNDGSNLVHARWYLIDGEIKQGYVVTGDITASDSSLIFGNMPYQGKIDDIRIYNRVLPRDEIQAIYHENGWDMPSVGADDIVGAWTFTDGALDDASGNGNTFNIHGTSLAPDRFGNSNSAYAFSSAAGDYMTTTGYTNIPTGSADRTITAWIRIDTFTSDEYTPIAFYGDYNTASASYRIGIQNSSHKIFFSTGSGVITPGSTLSEGVWYHIAILNIGGDVSFYLNGHIDDHGSSNMAINTIASPLFLGRDTAGDAYFNGEIDDVRIYDRALSGSEIYALAHSN